MTDSKLTHDWLFTGFWFIFYAPKHTNNHPVGWISYNKKCFMSFNAYPSMFTAYWGTFTCRLGGFWGRPEHGWCCNVIVEIDRGFRLHPTSILDVWNVFWHLDMLCRGIWEHPYTVTPVQVGGGFSGFWDRPEPKWCCNVMVEATTGIRLDPTSILDV